MVFMNASYALIALLVVALAVALVLLTGVPGPPSICPDGSVVDDPTRCPVSLTFSVSDPEPAAFIDHVEDGGFVALRSSVQNVTSNGTVIQYKSSQLDFILNYANATNNTFIAAKCAENNEPVFDQVQIERVIVNGIPHEAYKIEADTGQYNLSGSGFFVCENNCTTNVLFQGPAIAVAEAGAQATFSLFLGFSDIERDALLNCSVAFQSLEPRQILEKTFSLRFVNDRPPQISNVTCDATTPCDNPEHTCISFEKYGTVCAYDNPCSYLKCPAGQTCSILESFPPQVRCG